MSHADQKTAGNESLREIRERLNLLAAWIEREIPGEGREPKEADWLRWLATEGPTPIPQPAPDLVLSDEERDRLERAARVVEDQARTANFQAQIDGYRDLAAFLRHLATQPVKEPTEERVEYRVVADWDLPGDWEGAPTGNKETAEREARELARTNDNVRIQQSTVTRTQWEDIDD